MSENLFNRASSIGIGLVRAWLPEGRLEGKEWIAVNPNRPGSDGSGAFSINLTSGKWSDFSEDHASGNDAVSLYAYLNHDRLYNLAAGKNYKNVEGGIQAEAAREILTIHDPFWFPKAGDNFDVPKNKSKSGEFWDGFYELVTGVENPPELKTEWYQDKWGSELNRWSFIKSGKTIMIVVRFIDSENKKNDRPFTLWKNGTETKWRAKAPTGLYQLWNVDELEGRPNDPVIITEGQKAAAVIKSVLTDYVVVGWYGGTGSTEKTDWKPLQGREVWFPFDADSPGRKALIKIKKIAEELEIKLHPVYPPLNCAKGWDVADTIKDGWTAGELRDFIQAEKQDTKSVFLEDNNSFKFKILGYSGEYIAFYPFGSRKVVKHKASSLTKGVLMTLQDRALWGEFYQKEDGGIAWDSAVNDLIRRADEMPVFDICNVRGSGAWLENGKVVINTGEKIIVDDDQKELYETTESIIYERGRFIPYQSEKPISVNESKKILDILKMIDWEKDLYADILSGWILLAPFGGALSWRSQCWLTGPKGSGKSWVLENIINVIVGREYGVMGFGTSTPAGTRNALGNSSIGLIMDEMESDNDKYAEYIDQNLKMIREGASG